LFPQTLKLFFAKLKVLTHTIQKARQIVKRIAWVFTIKATQPCEKSNAKFVLKFLGRRLSPIFICKGVFTLHDFEDGEQKKYHVKGINIECLKLIETLNQ